MDRKFSFGNIKKELEKNIEESKKRGEEELLQEQAEQKAKQETTLKAKQEAEIKAQPTKHNIVVKGVELSDKQQEMLMSGGHIFLENMITKDRKR